jgi:hypothetical protein
VNNQSTLKDTVGSEMKVAVNSIQRTLFIERLYVNIYYPADRIIPYDRDNLYPNKVKSIAERSGTTSSAISKLSEFITGEGFTGMDTIVNREGQTLWDILRHVSTSKANFRGFALHFNYNLLGQITEINPINFEFVRWNKDLNRFIVNTDWARRRRTKDEVEYEMFNPAMAPSQMLNAGVDKYTGQLYYWIPNICDWYTICNWDSVLDDAQFEAEAKLYSLSSVQNDYSLSGIIAYPKNLADEADIQKVKENLKEDTGSFNAGGVRVIGTLPAENLTNWKWFTPISRNNIDGLHTKQKEDAKFNIYAAFKQPPILNGVATSGMFNQESFMDAFNYYNAATETDRKEVERELRKILAASVWSQLQNLQIMPKTYKVAGSAIDPQNPQASADGMQKNDTLTNLTGRQLQGIFRITRKYKKAELTYDQAASMLAEGFGFKEDQIKMWLINDEEEL